MGPLNLSAPMEEVNSTLVEVIELGYFLPHTHSSGLKIASIQSEMHYYAVIIATMNTYSVLFFLIIG